MHEPLWKHERRICNDFVSWVQCNFYFYTSFQGFKKRAVLVIYCDLLCHRSRRQIRYIGDLFKRFINRTLKIVRNLKTIKTTKNNLFGTSKMFQIHVWSVLSIFPVLLSHERTINMINPSPSLEEEKS